MNTIPVESVVTVPEVSTVAMVGSLEVQVVGPPTARPVESWLWAISFNRAPTGTVASVGDTATVIVEAVSGSTPSAVGESAPPQAASPAARPNAAGARRMRS